MALSLIAFDTDHIKSYVFGTDKLKEIRGASSLLDRLNRRRMDEVAKQHGIESHLIYTNGGAGLFLVDAQRAHEFGRLVQKTYRTESGGRASVTYVVQEIFNPAPPDLVQIANLNAEARNILQTYPRQAQPLLTQDLSSELELIRYKLREAKGCPHETTIALPSHPFMRYCDSCGLEYAERQPDLSSDEYAERHTEPSPGDVVFYCPSCQEKQAEDDRVKRRIPTAIHRSGNKEQLFHEYLWNRLLRYLVEVGYSLPADLTKLEPPNDFNDFRLFAKSKAYLGLIYADANNMGIRIEKLPRLIDMRIFADQIDDAIHLAICHAIRKHLSVVEVERDGEHFFLFPFDILLLGGDDIVMVTEATKAMEVALTTASKFRELTNDLLAKLSPEAQSTIEQKSFSLSIGVVLAPVNYPFALVLKLAESAMKYAKSESAKARAADSNADDTRINFLTVTGGSSDNFKKIFDETYHKKPSTKNPRPHDAEFYATLRPFTVQDLQTLLKAITDSKVKNYNLGRTKLHQIREAVLKMDLTTSVSQGLTILRSWRDTPRNYVVQRVYEFGGLRTLPHNDPRDPAFGFPRVTFPWFADGTNDNGQEVYRTPLLDFIELYDFVSTSGEESENAH